MKKLGAILACLPALGFCFSCPDLAGQWQGSYHDTQGLFPDQASPITLVLQYEAPLLYGYGVPVIQATYSNQRPVLFFAHCEQGAVSQLAVIRQNSSCGSALLDPHLTYQSSVLTFISNWQNAMIDTDFRFTLKRDSMSKPAYQPWLNDAKQRAQQTLQSCH